MGKKSGMVSKMLWNKETERAFFIESLKQNSPEKLFYKTDTGKYCAYWQKGYYGKKSTLQSRNSLIGRYSENWVGRVLSSLLKNSELYVVENAVCEEIGLTKQSPADVALCVTPNKIQKPIDIALIIEVKISVVWNWQYSDGSLVCLGDYKSHTGQPSLLRSDTMLKAIGKAINIRMFGELAAKIPILILGNTPISASYKNKVHNLIEGGIIQGMWSLNSNVSLDESVDLGKFRQFTNREEFSQAIKELITRDEKQFFSSYQKLENLGNIIELANKKEDYESKARCFLKLIKQSK